jgi:hypothetical protein
LESLDFKATPPNWQVIIRRCTDRTPFRPTFISIFQNVESGPCAFPGVDTTSFKAVLAQYPIQWIGRAEAPPPPLKVDYIDGKDILASSKHPQLVEYVYYVSVVIRVNAVDAFAGAISRYVGHGQPDHPLVRFLLSAAASFAQQGPEFRKKLLQSRFFTRLHITNLDQADILLEILPVFITDRDLLLGRCSSRSAFSSSSIRMRRSTSSHNTVGQ